VVIVIAILIIPRAARVVRSTALSVEEHVYVEAVQALGLPADRPERHGRRRVEARGPRHHPRHARRRAAPHHGGRRGNDAGAAARPLARTALRDALEHWRRGAPPPISGHDCLRAVELIDQAYALTGPA
jgi:hypothetical protein